MISQPAWQTALRDLVTDPLTLLSLLSLSPDQIPWQWDKQFPVRVTRSFIDRMEKGNGEDPLLRQVLSLKEESQLSFNYSHDPLQEINYNPVPGLLHKYPSRVLLTFTSSCAIHCRYCFRRHFPYSANNPGQKGWGKALDYIADHPEILEVILSGGDPLMAQDENIADFLTQLAAISHVQLLRFHTRLPILIPERIHSGFGAYLQPERFQVTMVYHINHPHEIIPEIAKGVSELKKQNITVLNQSVLLKGVNDDLTCLRKLSLALFQAGILPYYMHLLDPVSGTQHFEVSKEKARDLQQQLREVLPGYLVPRFVQEKAAAPSKMPLDLL